MHYWIEEDYEKQKCKLLETAFIKNKVEDRTLGFKEKLTNGKCAHFPALGAQILSCKMTHKQPNFSRKSQRVIKGHHPIAHCGFRTALRTS